MGRGFGPSMVSPSSPFDLLFNVAGVDLRTFEIFFNLSPPPPSPPELLSPCSHLLLFLYSHTVRRAFRGEGSMVKDAAPPRASRRGRR
jgi:hypothetical protein